MNYQFSLVLTGWSLYRPRLRTRGIFDSPCEGESYQSTDDPTRRLYIGALISAKQAILNHLERPGTRGNIRHVDGHRRRPHGGLRVWHGHHDCLSDEQRVASDIYDMSADWLWSPLPAKASPPIGDDSESTQLRCREAKRAVIEFSGKMLKFDFRGYRKI
ncbi:hypothetical protein BDN70DRAFT_899154 [Pholiota conissans]|uniref:Uncharacterized protein n=1 Tax=Pholiota conissans TaxID=109636 RepID=A0A9P6CVI4_9AGAR|nr:hypothetical protein BDN70DRAFT_899154 [Pholiota conissans]